MKFNEDIFGIENHGLAVLLNENLSDKPELGFFPENRFHLIPYSNPVLCRRLCPEYRYIGFREFGNKFEAE